MYWWREPTVGFVAAVMGGIVAWSVFYSGQHAWGYAIGALVTIFLLAIGFALDPEQGMWSLLGWTIVFFGLTWPLLWLFFWTPF